MEQNSFNPLYDARLASSSRSFEVTDHQNVRREELAMFSKKERPRTKDKGNKTDEDLRKQTRSISDHLRLFLLTTINCSNLFTPGDADLDSVPEVEGGLHAR
jgi:hypothetical protein